MDKRWAVVITLCFFLPLAGLGVYTAWDADKTVSQEENRSLAQRPAFSWDALFAGQWTRSFDEYYTDQFPGREMLILAGQSLDRLLYIPVKNSSAVIGGDFDLGEGESLEQILGQPSPLPPDVSSSPQSQPSPSTDASPLPEPTPSPAPSPSPEVPPSPEASPSPTPEPEVDLDASGYIIIGDRIMHMSYTSKARCEIYADMMNRLQDALPDRRVISMVVPNSFPFYAPSAYVDSSRNQQKMIENLYAMYDSRIIGVDSYTPVAAHKDEYLFFRSDHHWTARGAYWAYTGFCDALGYTPSDIETWEQGQYEGFIGSFYREVKQYPQAAAVRDNPDTVEYFIPPGEYTAKAYTDATMKNGWSIPVVNTGLTDAVSNKYICFTNGDQALIHINTDNKNGKSIAVVKESYGNAVIPFLLAHYENIYVFDYRKYNRDSDLPKCKLADFVTEHGIDDVMVISYPYVPNEKGFTNWLAMMMP